MPTPATSPYLVASQDVDLPNFSGTDNKKTPRTSILDNGYGYEQTIPANELNGILNNFGQWLVYLEELDSTGILKVGDNISLLNNDQGYIELANFANVYSRSSVISVDNTVTGWNKGLEQSNHGSNRSGGVNSDEWDGHSEFLFTYVVPASVTLNIGDPIGKVNLSFGSVNYAIKTGNFASASSYIWYELINAADGNVECKVRLDPATGLFEAAQNVTLNTANAEYYMKGNVLLEEVP